MDVLTSAHLGLTGLSFGDLETAKNTRKLLDKFMNIQPNLKSRFNLRINVDEKLSINFSELAKFC